jgi:ribose 5-phosphate isomerase
MMTDIRENQRRAAQAALPWLGRHEVVGIGTGSTVHHFIDFIAAERGNLKAVVSSSNEPRNGWRQPASQWWIPMK